MTPETLDPRAPAMSNDDAGGSNASDTPLDMAFVQYALPPLKSGNFTITVTQHVSVLGQGETFQASQGFYVAGERYSLGPTDVNSVFPPAGNQGEFSNNLAHVVLSSPTLPWQRSPNPRDAEPVAGQPVPTWLAVLLFDENDPPPKPQSVTVGDLVATPTTFFPPRVAEEGESMTDPVSVIDIPLALFNTIAPSLGDLNWTAHVRAVDPASKTANGGTAPQVDYSVVFGNRLPLAGNTSTAYLVSLEDFGPFLPAEDGTPSAAIPAGAMAVRVVVLQSWIFTALDLKQTFAGLLTQVSLDPPTLQLPYDSTKASGNTDADTVVKNAFGMGYTAMDHTLRDGSSTVSWYRGPLLPLGTPTTATPPWADADQLLRYNPTTGLFDASYSAAWQLGRLLALHDSAFAAALYRWKLTQTQAQVAALEQEIIDQELPPITQAGPSTPSASSLADASPTADVASARHARMTAVIKRLVGPAAERLRSRGEEG